MIGFWLLSSVSRFEGNGPIRHGRPWPVEHRREVLAALNRGEQLLGKTRRAKAIVAPDVSFSRQIPSPSNARPRRTDRRHVVLSVG